MCLRKSPFTMPNMWRLYKEKSVSKGPDDTFSLDLGMTIDVIAHPRALDQLFVAYGGASITSRKLWRPMEV